MKAYISSVLFLISMLLVLTATAYKLDEFNSKVAKAMFNQPGATVVAELE